MLEKIIYKKMMSIPKIKFLTSLRVIKNYAAKFLSNNTRKKNVNYRSILLQKCSYKKVF